MISSGAAVRNPLRFDADGLALFLVEGDAARSVVEAGRLPFARALELMVRLEKRSQERREEIERARSEARRRR